MTRVDGSTRYLVVEQRQLDLLSFARIPIGIVVLVTVVGVVAVALVRVMNAVAPGTTASWPVILATTAALAVGFHVTKRAVSLIRPLGARTRVDAGADVVRYWTHEGVERTFENRDLTTVGSTFRRLRVQKDGEMHDLPVFVERADRPGVDVSSIEATVSALKLGVVDGQVRLFAIRSSAAGADVEPLPYDS